jgi:hypothetical protein
LDVLAHDCNHESIVEHVAGIEDYQVALATFRAACERWPGTPITLSRRRRLSRQTKIKSSGVTVLVKSASVTVPAESAVMGAVLAATCGAAAPALLAAGSGVSVGGLAALFGQRHEAHVHEWMTESQILNGGIVLIGA